MLPAPRRRVFPAGRLALPLQRLFLLGQCFRSLQVMLQGRQRVLCEIGERALRLRFFLVFRDVLLMIRNHRLYELLIELGALPWCPAYPPALRWRIGQWLRRNSI